MLTQEHHTPCAPAGCSASSTASLQVKFVDSPISLTASPASSANSNVCNAGHAATFAVNATLGGTSLGKNLNASLIAAASPNCSLLAIYEEEQVATFQCTVTATTTVTFGVYNSSSGEALDRLHPLCAE